MVFREDLVLIQRYLKPYFEPHRHSHERHYVKHAAKEGRFFSISWNIVHSTSLHMVSSETRLFQNIKDCGFHLAWANHTSNLLQRPGQQFKKP